MFDKINLITLFRLTSTYLAKLIWLYYFDQGQLRVPTDQVVFIIRLKDAVKNFKKIRGDERIFFKPCIPPSAVLHLRQRLYLNTIRAKRLRGLVAAW